MIHQAQSKRVAVRVTLIISQGYDHNILYSKLMLWCLGPVLFWRRRNELHMLDFFCKCSRCLTCMREFEVWSAQLFIWSNCRFGLLKNEIIHADILYALSHTVTAVSYKMTSLARLKFLNPDWLYVQSHINAHLDERLMHKKHKNQEVLMWMLCSLKDRSQICQTATNLFILNPAASTQCWCLYWCLANENCHEHTSDLVLSHLYLIIKADLTSNPFLAVCF